MLDTTSYADKLPISLNVALKNFTGCEPIMVRYLKHRDGKKGKELNCHLNVVSFIKSHGGSSVSGWLLHRNQHYFDRGIYTWSFHSVWKNPEEKLVDVTDDKNYIGRDKSIFIHDVNRFPDVNQGFAYNNIVFFEYDAVAKQIGNRIGKNLISNKIYWCDPSLKIIVDINEHSGLYRLVNPLYPKNLEHLCNELDCSIVDNKLMPNNGSKYQLDENVPATILLNYNIKIQK